jgi:hypothetical protein
VSLEMQLEALIERGWKCSGRLRLSDCDDAIGSRDPATLEMRLQATIE